MEDKSLDLSALKEKLQQKLKDVKSDLSSLNKKLTDTLTNNSADLRIKYGKYLTNLKDKTLSRVQQKEKRIKDKHIIGYFYDERLGDWYQMINNETLENILFRSAKSYGNKWLTGILRFPVPYSKIKPGSRIVLVGKNIVGRYWYAQLLLSEYCEVVAWLSSEDQISSDMVYDNVILAG